MNLMGKNLVPLALLPLESQALSAGALLAQSGNQFMIFRVRRFLIEHFHRLPVQLPEIPLEPHPIDAADIVAIIVLDEQRQIVDVSKRSSLDGQFLYVVRARDLQSLGGRDIRGGGEVEIIAIVVDFQRQRR